MRPTQKLLIIVAVLAVAALLGVGIALLVGNSAPAPTPTTVVQNPPPTQPAPPTGHHPDPLTHQPTLPVAQQPSPHNPVNATPMPVVPETANTNEWESKLDDILASEGDDTNKSKLLLEMYPNLPEEGQVEVTEHLLNLMAGQDMTPLANILKDPKSAESVQDIILSDALNWSDQTKLPLLLDVAKDPGHPKAGEAKDWLELYVGEDHGTNWDLWGKGVQDYLKEHPE